MFRVTCHICTFCPTPPFFSSSVQDPAPFWCCGRPLQPIQHPKGWAGETHPKVWHFGSFCGWPQGWQMDSASQACAEAACHWSEVSTASTDEGSRQRDNQGASTNQSKEEGATENLVLKLVCRCVKFICLSKAIFFRKKDYLYWFDLFYCWVMWGHLNKTVFVMLWMKMESSAWFPLRHFNHEVAEFTSLHWLLLSFLVMK